METSCFYFLSILHLAIFIFIISSWLLLFDLFMFNCVIAENEGEEKKEKGGRELWLKIQNILFQWSWQIEFVDILCEFIV